MFLIKLEKIYHYFVINQKLSFKYYFIPFMYVLFCHSSIRSRLTETKPNVDKFYYFLKYNLGIKFKR